ncbi:hypothetical protein NLX83_04555 [Allokutzneria sp. A3M-2-11 16]|uniref:hypothetical protein n=1 Tax=Allokutzneria sp. A3M-2-11 16 TaxID=2962043 RepID=UPI0020B64CCF|nr:hypothetical protein [Allokutzneria sp. A3M-2-11 16]MCP3798523.1 hypothetical protein [Allokutzneria sp. A3M-2-11 16]
MNDHIYFDAMTSNDLHQRMASKMFLHEHLTRQRMREAEHSAAHERQARRMSAAQRWQWLASVASRRADRHKASF